MSRFLGARPVRALPLLFPLFLAVPTTAQSDQAAAGFALADRPHPGTFPFVSATLSNGEFVAFDGLSFDHYDEDGILIQHLADLPALVFPSFMVLDSIESTVIVGESTNGDLLEVPLGPATPDVVINLPFNFDAVYEDDDHLIVSAATCGFGCGNEIYRVDLFAGTATQLCQLAGASGPVALDDAGNLYYGVVTDQFPPPPTPSSDLRFDAQDLTGSPILDESDATILAAGLEGASALAYDPLDGALYLAANNAGTGVNRIRKILGHGVTPEVIVEGTAFNAMASLEVFPGDGVAVFAPYQPATGAELYYNTTDFASVFERKSVTTRRPTTAVTGPGTTGPGAFTIEVEGGPPSGTGFVFFGPDHLFEARRHVFFRRVPLFFGLGLGAAPGGASLVQRGPGVISLDGMGDGSITYQNPGGLENQWAVQVLLFEPSGAVAGTSSRAFF